MGNILGQTASPRLYPAETSESRGPSEVLSLTVLRLSEGQGMPSEGQGMPCPYFATYTSRSNRASSWSSTYLPISWRNCARLA